jgi:CRP-like cAMP-binding protein
MLSNMLWYIMEYQDPYCKNYLENSNSIFYPLSQKEKEILQENHSTVNYKKGDIIYKDGEKPSGLICLCRGKVKIFEEGIGGREQIVRMVKPIGLIGYRALFAEENYIASAVAIEDSTVCILEKDSLLRVMKGNAELTLRMIKTMATELGFTYSRTVTLTQKHIRGRLAESLLFLKNTYGFEEDGITIKVYLSREDIANLSNMTTSNAIRTLSTFASEMVIALDGRKIKILDLKKLERISELG